MKAGQITIKDVARLSGYSINTVSRALSGKGYVSPQAKQKILEIARNIGYYKDRTALSLRQKRTKIIGVVIVDNSNPFYADVLSGIEDAAYEKGFETILVNTYRDPDRERTAVIKMIERRVDGIIITSTQRNWEFLLNVNHKTNIVVVGSHYKGLKSVRPDDEKIGYIATKYLIQMGHKGILMFNSLPEKFTSQFRQKGYSSAMKEASLSEQIINSSEGFENSYRRFKDFLQTNLSKNITAVLCYNDIFAYAVINAAREMKMEIPKQLSVVGVDDLVFSSIIDPPLTTVHINRKELGRQAFLSVIGENDEEENVLDVQLIERSSVIRINK
ncbi:MAG TPA: LacI family DNA-binding transcriptional regulator [Pseudothermotoga sp.]